MPNYTESLPELFKRVSEAKTNDEKKRILREKDSKHLQTVLQGAFHPNIVWELPEGQVPYKKDDGAYGVNPSILEREIRKFPYFVSGAFGSKLIQNKMKRENIFIQMLESIHPTESELIIQMKDKNIKCDGLTARLVWEIFPDLIPEPPKPVVKKKKPAKKKKAKNE